MQTAPKMRMSGEAENQFLKSFVYKASPPIGDSKPDEKEEDLVSLVAIPLIKNQQKPNEQDLIAESRRQAQLKKVEEHLRRIPKEVAMWLMERFPLEISLGSSAAQGASSASSSVDC